MKKLFLALMCIFALTGCSTSCKDTSHYQFSNCSHCNGRGYTSSGNDCGWCDGTGKTAVHIDRLHKK